jgi:hypothetical protein
MLSLLGVSEYTMAVEDPSLIGRKSYREIIANRSLNIITTAIFPRMLSKYGERGYRFVLPRGWTYGLEHLLQLISDLYLLEKQ